MRFSDRYHAETRIANSIALPKFNPPPSARQGIVFRVWVLPNSTALSDRFARVRGQPVPVGIAIDVLAGIDRRQTGVAIEQRGKGKNPDGFSGTGVGRDRGIQDLSIFGNDLGRRFGFGGRFGGRFGDGSGFFGRFRGNCSGIGIGHGRSLYE